MSTQIIKGRGLPLRGEFTPPGDKSISHRAIIIGSLADGTSTVKGFLNAEDTISTVNAMRMLGVPIDIRKDVVIIEGKGLLGLREPDDIIDAGNSGTTARFLSGLLSPQNFFSAITGDKYLRARPMGRVVKPLTLMGARIIGREDSHKLPLAIQGNKLSGINYKLPVASAQVKSAILLAGLYANGETEVIESQSTRDHTERMLAHVGVNISKKDRSIRVKKTESLHCTQITIPGDISSAAFFIVAALINQDSEILIKNVGINPYRTGVVDILREMGGNIAFVNKNESSGELVSDIVVRSSALTSIDIRGEMIPRTIDELPAIAVAACYAQGKTIIKDAWELRAKETDRIKAMSTELKRLGAFIEETEDGMIINGKEILKGAKCWSWGDHRVAMALAVAATGAEEDTEIQDSNCVSTSFPEFFATLNKLRYQK